MLWSMSSLIHMVFADTVNIKSHRWRRTGNLSYMLNLILEYLWTFLTWVYTSKLLWSFFLSCTLNWAALLIHSITLLFSPPKGERIPLKPEDEELLRDDEPITPSKTDGIKKKERPTDKGVSWLVKTQYISPLSMESTKQVSVSYLLTTNYCRIYWKSNQKFLILRVVFDWKTSKGIARISRSEPLGEPQQ